MSGDRRLWIIGLVAVGAAAGLTLLDQGVEATSGIGALVLDFVDRLLLLGAAAAVAAMMLRLGRLEDRAEVLQHEIGHANAAAQDWRRKSRRLLDGLSEAVAAQFRDWGLTAAESDIAALMLKGLPLADIAVLRRTSETTIRQQAQAIYRKSGLANRAELAAFFLEDLFDVAGAVSPDDTAPGAGLN